MQATRQPILLVFPTLLALLIALMVRKMGMSFSPEEVVAPLPYLGGLVTHFQESWPRLSWAFWLLLHSAAALTLGRIGLRYNLYSSNCLLAIPLYGVVATGVFLGDDYLLGALVGWLMARIVRNYAASCRNGYALNALFRGSLYLGILPLIYAPALPLILFLLVVTILFHRTFREWIVALSGLFLPSLVICYLWWAFGNEFWYPIQEVLLLLRDSSLWSLFSDASVVLVLQLVLLLTMVLWALFYYLSDVFVATSKARAILTSVVWLFLLSLVTLFLPDASAVSFTLVAVPTALLFPFLFVRLPLRIANGFYLLMLLLFVLRLFW